MDVVLLSRLQFAVAAMFHFLFVPLTLGLSLIIAIMETVYVRTGDDKYKRMARFFGRIFIVTFAVGVVTGLTLEFQFGTNWAEYSKFVGDVFGSLLAIEATVAFFLESTFLAVWIFGWNRISPRLHVLSIWIVALASTLSAFWILAANSFMQHPVGFEINPDTGRAMLTDFTALITSETAINAFLHTVAGSFILSGFFVMGVSAYHIMKNQNRELFKNAARIGMYFALVFALFEVVQGHVNGAVVAKIQPTKLAAMESLWETSPEGEGADQTLILIPDEKNERNLVELIKIPNALSLLAYHRPDAEVKGLKEWPKDERPPVLVSFLAFRAMVGLGFLF
ncbi:MAG: cytochrome ubiquinol oxidase subunit I, partial [bacterium]